MQYACSGLSATFEVHYKTCIGRSTSPAGNEPYYLTRLVQSRRQIQGRD